MSEKLVRDVCERLGRNFDDLDLTKEKYCRNCGDFFDICGGHFYVTGNTPICKKRQKQLVTNYVKKNPDKHTTWKNKSNKKSIDNLTDSYIAQRLRARVGISKKIYGSDYDGHAQLFDMAREKLKLERSINKQIKTL